MSWRAFAGRDAAPGFRYRVSGDSDHRPSAPNALTDDLETVLALVSVQPRLGARVRNVGLSGVRRVHLARVHYHLYYRVASSGTELEVLAFWHTSRGTGPLIELSR